MPWVKCAICHKKLYAKPSHLQKGWGKYCSIECRTKSQFKGSIVKCFICNKEIYRSQKELRKSESNNYFCGKKCQAIWRNKYLFSGINHANWKDGEASYRQALIRSNKEKLCLLCGISDFRVLAVHHKDKNRKNNDILNLYWLCHNCHYLVHHYKKDGEKFNNMVAVVQQ